jgi:hypothetical protein
MDKPIEDLLLEMLPYFPKVYTQASYTPTTDEHLREFNLIYKFSFLPSDCLIFFVPTQSSIAGRNKLVIKVPTSSLDDTPTYQDLKFDIIIETNDGNTRPADVGDIIAYRMCTFRFAKGNTNTVILVNSPSYNSIQISNLTATNAKFLDIPTVGENSLTSVRLATVGDLSNIIERVDKLKDKISYGTADPEEALATKPNGTIYVQVEDE